MHEEEVFIHSQLIQIILTEDPVVVSFEAQLVFGPVQTQEDAEAGFSMFHHTQLLLDRCHTAVCAQAHTS